MLIQVSNVDIIHEEHVAHGFHLARPRTKLAGVLIHGHEANAGVAAALQGRQGHLHLCEVITHRDVLQNGELAAVNAADNCHRTDVGTGHVKDEGRVGESLQVEFARVEEYQTFSQGEQCHRRAIIVTGLRRNHDDAVGIPEVMQFIIGKALDKGQLIGGAHQQACR